MGLNIETLVKDALIPDSTKLGLDIGIKRNDLYFVDTTGRPLKTYAAAGESGIKHQKVENKTIVEPTRVIESHTLGGIALPSLDGTNTKKREKKKKADENLEKWFGLKKRELTPELEMELKAIQLRQHFDKKRFYKGNDSKKLPTHFDVGVVTYEGGMRAVGGGKESEALNAHTGRKKFKGKSLLQEILKDQNSKEWTTKTYRQVEGRHQEGRENGVKKANKKKSAQKNWKQKRR